MQNRSRACPRAIATGSASSTARWRRRRTSASPTRGGRCARRWPTCHQPATSLRSDVGDVFAAFRANFHPLRTLAVLALVAALGFGAWRAVGLWRANLDENVPTSTDAAAGLPAPVAAPGQVAIVGEDSEPLLRPLPESPAERWLFALDSQLRSGRLVSPSGDNAYDSLLAAWHADAGHPPGRRRRQAHRRAVRAGPGRVEGWGTGTREGRSGARTLASRIAQPQNPQRHATHAPPARRRVRHLGRDRARRASDDAGVQRLLAFADATRLANARLASLAARAKPMPNRATCCPGRSAAGQKRAGRRADRRRAAPGEPGRLPTLRQGDLARAGAVPRTRLAAAHRQAARLAIARFRAIGERPGGVRVLRRRRRLRAVAAEADRRTLYRLRAAAELAVPGSAGGKRVSQWLDACSGGLRFKRVVAGGSWRDGAETRPLEADRGCDDVGFRLVRDPWSPMPAPSGTPACAACSSPACSRCCRSG